VTQDKPRRNLHPAGNAATARSSSTNIDDHVDVDVNVHERHVEDV
jgi:hypothetical protein